MKKEKLYKQVAFINELTGAPDEKYNGAGMDKKANPGHCFLSGAYGGWRYEIMSAGGGSSDLLGTGYTTQKELYSAGRAYIEDLSYFLDHKDYFKRSASRVITGSHGAPHEVPNYRAIHCKFLAETNYRGQRIKFYENPTSNSDKKHSKTMNLDNEPGEHLSEYAYRILKNNGFNIMGRFSDVETVTFLCNNWAEDFIEIESIK